MKTIFSVIIILFFSIIWLNCTPDNRIKDLEKKLEVSNKLLAECQSDCPQDEGIAFMTKTKANQRLKIVYYYASGNTAEQVIHFTQTDKDWKLQSFLYECKGEKPEKIEFFAILDLDATILEPILADGSTHTFTIQQPASSPQSQTIDFIIKKNNVCSTTTSTGKRLLAPKAVYTVEMN